MQCFVPEMYDSREGCKEHERVVSFFFQTGKEDPKFVLLVAVKQEKKIVGEKWFLKEKWWRLWH